jgi:hypothetical protein
VIKEQQIKIHDRTTTKILPLKEHLYKTGKLIMPFKANIYSLIKVQGWGVNGWDAPHIMIGHGARVASCPPTCFHYILKNANKKLCSGIN